MTSRIAKTAVVLLLGFLLVWRSGPTASAGTSANMGGAKPSCCRSGCDSKHCHTPACCARPADHRAPFAPTSIPSSSQNEWQALAASFSSWLSLPSFPVDEPSSHSASSALVTAIPLFQRDCRYLI